MTKTFNKDSIIPITGGYVVVDRNDEQKAMDLPEGTLCHCLSVHYGNLEQPDKFINPIRKSGKGDNCYTCNPIIATIGIKIEGVPLIEESSTNSPLSSYHNIHTLAARISHIGGYMEINGHVGVCGKEWGKVLRDSIKELLLANTKQYSEEEVISLVQKLYKPIIEGYYDDMGERQVEKLKKDIVKSLQKVPIFVELEYETTPIGINGNIIGTNQLYPYSNLKSNFTIQEKLKVNPDNTITPKSINYDSK